MFTNRSFHLFTVIALLIITACIPQTEPVTPTITSTPTLITTNTVFDGRLLFSRFIEASHTFTGMYISETDGSSETAVPLPGPEGGGRWSRDGQEIAIMTILADGRVGTAIIAPDGIVTRTFEIPHPTLNLVFFVWTRDNVRLACQGWDDANQSLNGIYTVRSSDGGDLQRLTNAPAGKNDEPGDFSPDGQLVFIRVNGGEPPGFLMLVNESGSEPSLLTNGLVGDTGRFAPDGLSVITSSNGNLLVIGLDGSILHEITIAGHFLFGPVWSPDGTDLQQVTHTSENEITVDWGVGSE